MSDQMTVTPPNAAIGSTICNPITRHTWLALFKAGVFGRQITAHKAIAAARQLARIGAPILIGGIAIIAAFKALKDSVAVTTV